MSLAQALMSHPALQTSRMEKNLTMPITKACNLVYTTGTLVCTCRLYFFSSKFIHSNEKQQMEALIFSLKHYLLKDGAELVLISVLNGTCELLGFGISVKGTEFAGVVCDKSGKVDPIWFT